MTTNDVQTFGAMIEGIELVSNLITHCAIFEELYLQTAITSGAEPGVTDRLAQAILMLYVTILRYLSKAKRYYGGRNYGMLMFP
jgi:hypothetical protein